ncbi:enoyl-CoA hydratase [Pseudomonas endophytica]|uniref:Enoyl-CoA hydratase n=1 Tax=Pseudomonas endophytica TaxID=1563157 RepID=A0A0Q0T2T3_9PSED|nr:enoyl-CoA hydratase [Pseudomonas endophytica]KQB53648.1 enoyl-CoA hydratase [Pseudomonas endophytica]
MNDLIQSHQRNGLLTLTLNRPDKLNALTNGMYNQLADLLFAAGEDPSITAIIITGGEQCFTSGNDLKDFLQDPPTQLNSPAFRFMDAVIQLDKPLIAAVCGAAIGIGTTLLLHCDQVLVTRNAKLRMPFVNLGLCPEFGASLLLPRLIGHTQAARLLLWGDGLDGTQAVALGLANEVFEDGPECLNAAQQLAEQLIALPRDALLHTKRLLKQPVLQELKDTLRRENLLFMERLKSTEAKTLLEAMLARSAAKG